MRAARLLVAVTGMALLFSAPAAAEQSCRHVVVLTLPGVTWRDIDRVAPPAILSAIQEGASGSMSVRTISSRTSYSSGYATLGAGARVEGGVTTGGPARISGSQLMEARVPVAGVDEIQELAAGAGYGAEPGALASALEGPVSAVGNSDLEESAPATVGYGRWG